MLQIELIGFLAATPEIREGDSGKFLCFDVGVSRKSASGDSVTTWVRCTKAVMDGGNVAKYMGKGTRVFVRGDLSVTAYMNRNGAAIPTVACRVRDIKLLGNGKE